jgi:hypothetical protein
VGGGHVAVVHYLAWLLDNNQSPCDPPPRHAHIHTTNKTTVVAARRQQNVVLANIQSAKMGICEYEYYQQYDPMHRQGMAGGGFGHPPLERWMEGWMSFAKMSASSPEISSTWANFVDVCICVPSQHFSSHLQVQDRGIIVCRRHRTDSQWWNSVSIADNMNSPSPPLEPAFVFDMRYQTGKWRTALSRVPNHCLFLCFRDVDVSAGNRQQQQQEQQGISAAVPQHPFFICYTYG